LNKIILILLVLCPTVLADAAFSKNKQANKLYSQGNYAEALKLYDEALLASPEEKNLAINKGSALFKLKQFDKAAEAYESALSIKDKKTKAALLYNLGTDQISLAQGSGQEKMDQAQGFLEKAKENYIAALDADQHDEDTKWNLEIVNYMLKQMEQQQQQQNKQNKDQNNQDKKQQQQQQQDQQQKEQDQQQQNKPDQQQQQKKEQQQQPQPQQPGQEKKEDPTKQMTPEQMEQKKAEEAKKQDAVRLLLQYSDDAKELNKPPEHKVAGEKRPDKDW
jgi:Ca-activated chloride channel family protein